jgi:hypothetical protein
MAAKSLVLMNERLLAARPAILATPPAIPIDPGATSETLPNEAFSLRISEVIVPQSFATHARAQHAVFPWFFPKIPREPAFSPEDSEDYTIYART